jgi:hypothetical protein
MSADIAEIIDRAANEWEVLSQPPLGTTIGSAISDSGGRHGSCKQLRVMSDSSAITWWIGILTILIGVQTIAIAVLAIKGLKLFTRAHTTLDGVDRALEPITQGTRELIQDLHALRETAQRAERGVSAAIDGVTRTTDHVKHAVVRRFWPVFGTVAAGRAVFKAIAARRRASRKTRDDEIADARFVAEGGPVHEQLR